MRYAYLPHAAEMSSWVIQMGKEYRLKKKPISHEGLLMYLI